MSRLTSIENDLPRWRVRTYRIGKQIRAARAVLILVEGETGGAREDRLHSIDWVRGIVMVLMALDHVRDWFGELRNPHDVANVTPALYLTRWITHFCAPTFVFLAGTSVHLYAARGRGKGEVSRYLVTRGSWLILLELTVVNFAWIGVFPSPLIFWQVIGVIGAAMVVLGALIHLPRPALLALGLLLVAGHNLLDPIEPAPGRADLWRFLHEGAMQSFGLVTFGEVHVLVVYPVLPWIGVMALGYGLGPVFLLPRPERSRALARSGTALVLAFLFLRGLNLYGDPTAWSSQSSPWRTMVSFLDCQKYPPSLAYLLMTLGPALVALGLLDREPGSFGRACIVFGRVPLFYYVVHLLLIHSSSMLVHRLRNGEAVSVLRAQLSFLPDSGFAPLPEGFEGLALGWVWAVWIAVVMALHPLCAWYARLKGRSRSPLLRYL